MSEAKNTDTDTPNSIHFSRNIELLMEGRRGRRLGRSHNSQTILPLRVTHLSNTISCLYCDFKTSVFNGPLFRFGRRHARCLRIWFTMGMGFSLTLLAGVILILFWELAGALHLHNFKDGFSSLVNGFLVGFYSSIFGRMISLTGLSYIFVSSVVSIFIHEVGHGLAAASEGIQIEYIAVFLAVLFPGALAALNSELLQALSRNASLRIYCAGIWHNAALCAACSFFVYVLPLLLKPFYVYGECPMVLSVSPQSPLASYLAPGDIIMSFDNSRIHTVQEWNEKIALLNMQMLQFGNSSDSSSSLATKRKTGFCIPSSLIGGSIQIHGMDLTCPGELFPFISFPCFDSHNLEAAASEENYLERAGNIYCLNPKDIIKLKKCGRDDSSSCSCLRDESCFSPVQMPGLAWVEITYSSRLPGCQKTASASGESNCTSTFTFLGDTATLGHGLHLTSYLPRWPISIGMSLPIALEKLFVCTFHVSLILALLNSLPVYFLDGESILEVIVQNCVFVKLRTRRSVVKLVLGGGTLATGLIFFRIFFIISLV